MKRVERARLSIVQGNAVQGAMLLAGIGLLSLGAQPIDRIVRVIGMLTGYLCVYFSTHASAHWLIGRLAGIRFTHYSVGGSTHAASYPPGMRQVFERLPFFAVHTDKMSLAAASPERKALMFGAGMTSSVVCSTLAALGSWRSHIPGGGVLFLVNAVWFIAALIAETRQGDYVKAARALNSTPALPRSVGEGD